MKLLWLQSGGCGGCTLSWLGSEQLPVLLTLRDEGIEILYHPSLSQASGDEARNLILSCMLGNHPFDILCVEGSLLRGPNGSGRFHMLAGSDMPFIHVTRELAKRAKHVVAVGSCAAFGGITAGGMNPNRCLRPAIRRRERWRSVGGRVPRRYRDACHQCGRVPDASGLGD